MIFSNLNPTITCRLYPHRISLAIILISFLLLSEHSLAQTPAHIQYNANDGMVTQQVFDIIQDQEGNLLMGTNFGVYKFDGETFENVPFLHPSTISSQPALKLRTSPDGARWVSMMGEGIFRIEDGLIKECPQNKRISIPNTLHFITNFYVDRAHMVYFTQRGRAEKIYTASANSNIDSITCKSDHGPGHFIHLHRLPESGVCLGFHCRKKDREQDAASANRAKSIKTEDGWIINITDHVDSFNVRPFSYVLARETASHLWLGVEDLIYSRELETGEERFQKSEGAIVSIDSLGINSVSISTSKGLYLSDGGTSNLEHQFASNLISRCMRDREGGTWISTGNSGLFYIPNLAIRTLDLEIVQNQSILHVSKEKGSGLVLTLPRTAVHLAGNLSKPTIREYQREKFRDVAINTQLDGHFYMGNVAIELAAGRLETIELTKDRILCTGRWMNKVVGITRSSVIDLSSGRSWETPKFLNNRTCIGATEHTIYIGTNDGLDALDVHTGVYKRNVLPEFSGQVIRSIQPYKSDSLLIVMHSGVYILHKKGLVRFDESNGLSTSFNSYACWESKDTFWVSSNQGVSRMILYPDGSSEITNIGRKDGLSPSYIEQIFYLDDTLFIPTELGLRFIKTKDLDVHSVLPKLRIKSISVNDSVHKTSAPVQLEAAKRNLRIDYSLISFKPGQMIEYAYLLEGFQSDWVTTKDGFAAYFNLPPGEYQFRAKARSKLGDWGEETTAVRVVVPAELHELALFWIAVGLLIIFTFSSLAFWFFRQKNERRKSSWGYANAQLQALGLQMNPHFLFNALNSIQALAYGQQHSKVNAFIAKLSGLIRTMLQHSDKPLIPLAIELQNLERYLDMEKVRFENKPFSYTIETGEGINLDHAQLPPMLLQPIAENALWHGLLKKEGPRELNVICDSLEKGFRIRITDNGIGYTPAANTHERDRPSISLKNIQQRLDLYNRLEYGNAHFSIEAIKSDAGQVLGTEVTFIFKA